MMDVISSTTAIVGLVFNFTTAIKACNDLHGRYKDAPRTIRSIKNELVTLQGALQELASLMMHDASSLTSRWDTNKSLPTTFARAVRGFRRTIKDLQDDIEPLRRGPHDSQLTAMDKVKLVWNENGMKEHLVQLRAQSSALQLLLLVLQTSSISEFKNSIGSLEIAVSRLSISSSGDDTLEDYEALPQYEDQEDLQSTSVPHADLLETVISTPISEEPTTLMGTTVEASTSIPTTSGSSVIHGQEFINEQKSPLSTDIPPSHSREESVILIQAVVGGDLLRVKELFSTGHDINVQHPKNRRTGAIFAAIFGHAHILEFLIDSGANIDHKDKDNRTPLHHAASEGHTSCAKLLVSRGASVVAKDSFHEPVLHYAIRHNAPKQLVESLLSISFASYSKSGLENDLGQTPLHVAVLYGRLDLLQELLEYSKVIEHQQDCITKYENDDKSLKLCYCSTTYPWLDHEDCRGRTPLQVAIKANRLEELSVLLGFSKPDSVNAPQPRRRWSCKELTGTRGFKWERPLHLATGSRRHTLLYVLLSWNADVLSPDMDGYTALDYATYMGNVEAVQMFLEHDSQLNRRDITALHKAVQYGRPGLVKYFLDRGWSPGTKDNKGRVATEMKFSELKRKPTDHCKSNSVEDYEKCKILVQDAIDQGKATEIDDNKHNVAESGAASIFSWPGSTTSYKAQHRHTKSKKRK